MSVEHFIVGENTQKAEPHGYSGIRPQGYSGYYTGVRSSGYASGIDTGSSTISDSVHYHIVGRLESVTPLKVKTLFDHFKELLKRH